MSGKTKMMASVSMLATAIFLCQYMTAFAGSVSYDYDELNRLKSIRYDNGTEILYSYDEVGNRTQEQTYSTVSAPYTITVSSFGCGSVTPATGLVMAQSGSSKAFSFQASPGNYLVDVVVDGVSLGIVPSYTFSNISGNHTLSVRFIIPDGDLTLDGAVNGADVDVALRIINHLTPLSQILLAHGDVAPSVNGNPSPNGMFELDDLLMITRKADGLNSWPTVCFPAQPNTNLPVRIVANPASYYRSLQSAYNSTSNGATVQAMSAGFTENANFNRNVSVFIDGGYGSDYAANPNYTTINGTMTISNGTVKVRNIVVR